MNLKETVINGALVAFHPISGLNATYLNLTIRAGSWYEEGNSWGEMHLLEHLLFLGSEKFPTKILLDDYMEENGIQCNGYTGGAKIEVVMRFPDTSIDSALILLSQMVYYPLFRQQDILNEKRVLHREYTDKWSKVDVRFSRKIRQQLFGTDSIYIRDGIGDPKYTDTLSEEQLRATHARFMVPSNMCLGIAGNVNIAETTEKLKVFFKNGLGVTSELPTAPIHSSERIIKTKEENLKSTSVVVTWLTKGIHDYSIRERMILSFGSYLLGGSRRSTLHRKVRDELGLAYNISSNTALFPTSGWLQVNTSTKPESTDEVVEKITKSVSEFLKQDIDETTLSRAKKYIKWQRLLQFDSGSSTAGYLSDSLYWDGKLVSSEEFENIVDGITAKDIKDIFSKIIANEPYISIMEPANR